MLYAVGSPLPEYRVRAFNNAQDSSNRIHDDTVARRLGFCGGLVPGVSIYAYMTHLLAEFTQGDWLERGSAEVRFVHPVYEGEELRISGRLTRVEKSGSLLCDILATNSQGIHASVGSACLPAAAPQGPEEGDYPAGRRAPGRPISLDALRIGERLKPSTIRFSWSANWEYCQKEIRDHSPLFLRVAHPGWLLTQANRILALNYDLPPWIHVASSVQNFRSLRRECLVITRGRVCDKFERKGHHYVVVEVASFAGKHCLQTATHTAIFRIAPRAA